MGPTHKPLCHVFKPIIEEYKSFRSSVLPACSVPFSVSHISLYQPVVISVPYVNPVRIATEIFPSQEVNIVIFLFPCYILCFNTM